MVSSHLNLELQELLDTLERLRQESGDTPEYLELRRALPDEWPV